jgi:hypothetical protein
LSENVLTEEETKAEPICTCGAEVRAESQYCYNCGGKIRLEEAEKQTGVRTFNASKNGSTRGKPRTRRIRPEQQNVEVMWRPSDGPGYRVLFVALGMSVIVAVFLAVAMYLR